MALPLSMTPNTLRKGKNRPVPDSWVRASTAEQVEWIRHLHLYPIPGTFRLLCQVLSITKPLSPTACVYVGSEKAGPKVAAILSVTESCRRISASPRDYLADVLRGLVRQILQTGRTTDSRPLGASRGLTSCLTSCRYLLNHFSGSKVVLAH
jgi:hypothetical protein